MASVWLHYGYSMGRVWLPLGCPLGTSCHHLAKRMVCFHHTAFVAGSVPPRNDPKRQTGLSHSCILNLLIYLLCDRFPQDLFLFSLHYPKILYFCPCQSERKRVDEESAFFALFHSMKLRHFYYKNWNKEKMSVSIGLLSLLFRYNPVEQLSIFILFL